MYVAFSGNIAVGKSVASELLANKLGVRLVQERVDTHPLLKRFYDDPHAWAFRMQMFNIADRARSILDAAPSGDFVVDRSYEEDVVFVDVALTRGLITPEEHAIYADLFDLVGSSLPRPGLMVYLRVDKVDELRERLVRRAREIESTVSVGYLESLQQRYDLWYKQYSGPKVALDSRLLAPEGIVEAVQRQLGGAHGPVEVTT